MSANVPYIDQVSRIDPTPGAWPGDKLRIPIPPPLTLRESLATATQPDLLVITYVRQRTVHLDGSVSWCWIEER